MWLSPYEQQQKENETKEGKGVSTRSYLKKKKQADSQEIVTGVFLFLNIYRKYHLNTLNVNTYPMVFNII